MKKFTIVCISIDFLVKKSATQIFHCEAPSLYIARDACEKNHPDFIIVTILPSWHNPA